jgi:hypothetical protein
VVPASERKHYVMISASLQQASIPGVAPLSLEKVTIECCDRQKDDRVSIARIPLGSSISDELCLLGKLVRMAR